MRFIFIFIISYSFQLSAVFSQYTQMQMGNILHLYADVHTSGSSENRYISEEQKEAEPIQLGNLNEQLRKKSVSDKPLHFLVEEPVKEVIYKKYEPLLRLIRPSIAQYYNVTVENAECRLYTLAYYARQNGNLNPVWTLENGSEVKQVIVPIVTEEDVKKEIRGVMDSAERVAKNTNVYNSILKAHIALVQKDADSFPDKDNIKISLLDLHLLTRTIELVQKGYDVAICSGQSHTTNIRKLLQNFQPAISVLKHIEGKKYLTDENMKESFNTPKDQCLNYFRLHSTYDFILNRSHT